MLSGILACYFLVVAFSGIAVSVMLASENELGSVSSPIA